MPVSNQKIVLFDGVCNLCNGTVQFIIKRDKKDQFLFASLQGVTGQKLLKKFHFPLDNFNSFILVEGHKAYTRSSGILRIFKHLGGGWSILSGLNIVPPYIRDGIYKWIATNRYKWFGKQDECWVPTPALKAKFLD